MRRHWIKLWSSWYSSPSHEFLPPEPLHTGPRLLLIADKDPDWRETGRGRLLHPSGRFLRARELAVTLRWPLEIMETVLAELVACGTLEREADGWTFPNYRDFQVDPRSVKRAERRVKSMSADNDADTPPDSPPDKCWDTRADKWADKGADNPPDCPPPEGQKTDDRRQKTERTEGGTRACATPAPPAPHEAIERERADVFAAMRAALPLFGAYGNRLEHAVERCIEGRHDPGAGTCEPDEAARCVAAFESDTATRHCRLVDLFSRRSWPETQRRYLGRTVEPPSAPGTVRGYSPVEGDEEHRRAWREFTGGSDAA